MRLMVIPDAELLGDADTITVWVASPDAPTDMWSLRDAIVWVMGHPQREAISLFRPPGDVRAAWLRFAQIERLAFALDIDPVVSAV